VLVETWLNSNILDAELGFDCYNVFRLDRSDKTSNSTRGGGVAIFVNKRFEAEIINIQHDSVEQLFVLIKWGNNDKCIIGACYLTPHSPLNNYTVHTEMVEWLFNKYTFDTNLLLYGDYYLPQVRFTSNDIGLICNGTISSRSEIIFDCFSSLNLHQLNNILNVHGCQLDLVFSNNPLVNVMPSDDSIVPIDLYHPVLTTNYMINISPVHICPNSWFYDFKKANYDQLNLIIAGYNWSNMYKLSDINAAVNIFNIVVLDAIDQTVPKKLIRSRMFPKWFSQELCVLIKQKKRQHKLFKSSGNNADYEAFSALRKKCKIMSKLCYNKYVEQIQSYMKNNPRYFWSYIKNKQKINVIPYNITDGIAVAKNVDDTVNMLKSYFESVYSQSNINVDHIQCYNTDINFNSCQITITEVFDTPRNLSYKTQWSR